MQTGFSIVIGVPVSGSSTPAVTATPFCRSVTVGALLMADPTLWPFTILTIVAGVIRTEASSALRPVPVPLRAQVRAPVLE